jgi:hypothetical protein
VINEYTADKQCIVLVVMYRNTIEIKSRLKFRECLLLFGAESFVFQVAIQKLKDQDI